MLDKILVVNENQVVIYFTHRSPFTVTTDNGTALQLADELLCPFNTAQATTLTEYTRIQAVSLEDTQVIDLEEVA